MSEQWNDTLAVSGIFAILGLSVVVSTGYGGQVNLLPLGLTGLSALFAGWVSQNGVGMPGTLGLSVLFAAVLGLAVGAPSVRSRGSA
ncbi:hypothetical protein NKH77_51530 [Streptomyces sp. M19]